MPAWMDIVGRAIPVTLRGRFFALSNLAAAGVGFAGSFLTAHVLAVVRAPASFGVCFLCASACMALSYLALALVREPAATTSSPAVALGTYLRRIPPLLRRDANLRWFLLARALARRVRRRVPPDGCPGGGDQHLQPERASRVRAGARGAADLRGPGHNADGPRGARRAAHRRPPGRRARLRRRVRALGRRGGGRSHPAPRPGTGPAGSDRTG